MKSAASYTKVHPLQHVIARPAMYVGSCSRVARRDWGITNIEGQDKAVVMKTDTPYGVFHLFKEGASNMGDNVNNSRLANVQPGECHIAVTGSRVTMTNSGLCIPIENNNEGVLVPMMIFSELLSGSNLGDNLTGGGAHGIGCKAIGALSTDFSVRIDNPIQRKSFRCTWKKNYSEVDGPHVSRYTGKEPRVRISYVIDHRRFGYTELRFAYSESDLAMFKWIAASLSFTAGVPVYFNGERLDYTLRGYAALYTAADVDSFTIETDTVSCIVLDTPGAGKQVGFCNHIINFQGGTHVKAPLQLVKDYINKARAKKAKKAGDEDGKTGKGKKAKVDKDDEKEKNIGLAEIKPHVTVIISVSVLDVKPEFGGGQMKTSLTFPEITLECSSKTMARVSGWGLMRQLDMKTFAKFGVADASSKRGRHLRIKTGEDATLAGTKDSHLCELHCVEGDSAEGYDSELLNFIPGGRRTVGTFVMRGKLLNVLKASDKQIQKNRELNELSMRLGLKMGADYHDEKVRKSGLRYGKLVMMADADEDGNHIRGLMLAFFHRFYPSLLEVGFVVDYMTPYLRATAGRTVHRFFYEKQYEDWRATVDESKWTIRYFKGLGASETPDIKQDYDNKKEVMMVYDEAAAAKIELVMGKGQDATDDRKKWVLGRDPNYDIKIGKSLPITEFMDYFVRNYSYSTLGRNMKRLSDGLTEVACIIIRGTFHFFGRQCKSAKSPKVTDFAGLVGNLYHYHHGDSIQKSVITLAQAFVGSNNLPLLIGKGRFGSMQKGGKHASQPRYLEVKPSPLLPLIFRAEDDPLLVPREVEGEKVEPEHFLPIIPLALVNGASCVCTGWSSHIPNYDPLQIIDAFLSRLNKRRFQDLVPWYRGYKGKITMRGNEMICKGIVKFTSPDDYILTCLPIGVWNNRYRKDLMEKVINKEIEDYESRCTATDTWFSVKGVAGTEPLTAQSVGAETTERLSNLVLLGPNGLPMEWYTVAAIMEDFYRFRLPFYTKRKEAIVARLKRELEGLRERKKYIQACLNRDLVFDKDGESRDREAVLADIARLGLRSEFYVPGPGKKSKKIAHGVDADEDKQAGEAGLSVVLAHKMDKQGLAKMELKMEAIVVKIQLASELKAEEMWKSDLLELRAAYLKIYTE